MTRRRSDLALALPALAGAAATAACGALGTDDGDAGPADVRQEWDSLAEARVARNPAVETPTDEEAPASEAVGAGLDLFLVVAAAAVLALLTTLLPGRRVRLGVTAVLVAALGAAVVWSVGG